MKIPKCLNFHLRTIKKYDKFDSVRFFLNEKESDIIKFNVAPEYIEYYETYNNKYKNEVLKFKNKDVDLELIFSIEEDTSNYYFFHNLNNDSLIIKLDCCYCPRNFYDYFCFYFNFNCETISFYKILHEK